MYRAVEICWQSILLSAKWPSPHFWKIKVAPYQVLTAMEIKCSSSLTNMEIMEISNFVLRKHIHFTRTQIKGFNIQIRWKHLNTLSFAFLLNHPPIFSLNIRSFYVLAGKYGLWSYSEANMKISNFVELSSLKLLLPKPPIHDDSELVLEWVCDDLGTHIWLGGGHIFFSNPSVQAVSPARLCTKSVV